MTLTMTFKPWSHVPALPSSYSVFSCNYNALLKSGYDGH